ncbi:MAG: hypothetical protein OXC10_21560 [Rhodospirillaceae bacterium]|nr:hypothetical protein [Rhodospirillaceae bacterium]
MSSRLGIAGIVLLTAFGLAACGGGGGGTATMQEPTQAELDAARIAALQGQINTLRAQLGLGPDDDLSGSVTDLMDEVADLRQQIQDAADAAADADRKAMAATAAKLYAGIRAQMGAGDGTTFADTDRDAFYNADGTAILVSIGDGSGTAHTEVTATLSEDKKTMVAANHGWAGKRYADAPGGDMVEAVVYSNVAAPKMGKKFGGAEANDEFEYALTSGVTDPATATQNGEVAVDTSGAGVPARVALTGVTRTAGTETFKFSPSEVTDRRIDVPGSYHGVSGTYYCTPTTRADGCSASVAASGFTLAGGDWAFKPGDPNARVMSAPDTAYASYGWWLRKSADGTTYTASAFVDEKGDVPAATGLNALNGTATYVGGAAGKYALSSNTGGTNDAGHFTARATLEANFTANTADDATTNGITGTIDMFRGADGMPRDWEVTLNGSPIGDTGVIGDTDDGTVWTIGGTAGSADGEWSGSLRNNGTDGVPQVATGTFYSTYGPGGGEGRMVGGFGANKQ